MTPRQLRRSLAAAEARAVFHETKAATARAEVEGFKLALAILEHGEVNSVTIPGKQMQLLSDETKMAISVGSETRKGDGKFFETIRAKKYTLTSLAEAIGESKTLLSLQRKGSKPMPIERARQIQKLTGWPADAKHWKRLS